MLILETLLSWAAIAAGFISAWLWYGASGALVLKGDPRSKGGFLTGTKDARRSTSTQPWSKGHGLTSTRQLQLPWLF
jgi:hypothetical protein